MQRRHFSSNGIHIAFVDEGDGEPILLIHGFASNLSVNWRSTSWIDTLLKDGRRVIAMDVRGHGQSGKLHDPEAYRLDLLAEDARNLLDHLVISRADVMGYSMGGRIAAFMAVNHPEYVRSLVIGGIGMAVVDGMEGGEAIVAALEAPAGASVDREPGRSYRKFAEQTGSDLLALAACMRVARETLSPEQLSELRMPVLVAVGERDTVAGSPEGLAKLIPGAELQVIPGRDHMLATGDKAYKERVLAFLAERP